MLRSAVVCPRDMIIESLGNRGIELPLCCRFGSTTCSINISCLRILSGNRQLILFPRRLLTRRQRVEDRFKLARNRVVEPL